MATEGYEGKHAGPGKSGYSRGKREKPAESNMAFKPETVTLGNMTAPHIMGYHEGMRQSEGQYAQSAKFSAMGDHPSAGSRSGEFHQAAMDMGKVAENSRTRAVASAVVGKTRGAQMSGRQENFDLSRHYGRLGIN